MITGETCETVSSHMRTEADPKSALGSLREVESTCKNHWLDQTTVRHKQQYETDQSQFNVD